MSKPSKQDCRGCNNDFYNGNNPYGVEECWSFKSAEMVKKLDVPISMPPPYLKLPVIARPSCYKAKGYVRVAKDSLTKDGFWKG